MRNVVAKDMRMPVLGLGTWQLSGEPCAARVREALELGYRHLDTAQGYENEREVGRGIAAARIPREQLFLTTKLAPRNLERARVRASAHESLAELGTDYVDLLLIHWPSREVPLEETLDALLALRESGVIRHIGVSNFPPGLFERAAARAPIACNQVEYHPFLAQDRVLAAARAHGAALVAYCPLARGRILSEPVLTRIAAEHARSPAQIALAWLMQQPAVCAIPKASSSAHLQENLASLSVELTPAQQAELGALARGERLVNPGIAPDWES
jgi:2,5-diketo-D-gluconate reductase B